MSRVGVVTDSTADIPSSLAAELGIEVVPCYVHFGQETYLDGVDLSRQQFYARLAAGGRPTTSQPPVGTFEEVYSRLAEETDEIVSIHPAANLSAIYNAARLAAESVSGPTIALVDSTQASMGTGWLAVLAARAAQAGQSLKEVVAMLQDTIPRLRLLAVVSDLRYLQRSGRVSWVNALVGSWLNIKPVVMLKDGQLSLLEKVRSQARALERLVVLARALGSWQEVAVLHADAADKASALAEMVAPFHQRANVPVVEAGVVMSSHAGPGTVALACVLEAE